MGTSSPSDDLASVGYEMLGGAFARHYYATHDVHPHNLALFYDDSSVMVRALQESEESHVVVGKTDIAKAFEAEREGVNVTTSVFSVDFSSMPDGGVVVTATGVLKREQAQDGTRPRSTSFVQTFVISPRKDKGSFVVASDMRRELDTVVVEKTKLGSVQLRADVSVQSVASRAVSGVSGKNTGSLEGVPIKVLQHIFSFLRVKDLPNAQLVCRTWRDAFKSEQLWKTLLQRRWGVETVASLSVNAGPVGGWRGAFAELHRDYVANRKITRYGQQMVSYFNIWHRGLFDLTLLDDIIAQGEKTQLLLGNNIVVVVNEILNEHHIDPVADLSDREYFHEVARAQAQEHLIHKILNERGVKASLTRNKARALAAAFVSCFDERDARYFVKLEDEECILFEAGLIIIDSKRGILLWQGF